MQDLLWVCSFDNNFVQLVLNDADMLKSSSILTYKRQDTKQCIYAQRKSLMKRLFKVMIEWLKQAQTKVVDVKVQEVKVYWLFS
jgi:hypothetical protein